MLAVCNYRPNSGEGSTKQIEIGYRGKAHVVDVTVSTHVCDRLERMTKKEEMDHQGCVKEVSARL